MFFLFIKIDIQIYKNELFGYHDLYGQNLLGHSKLRTNNSNPLVIMLHKNTRNTFSNTVSHVSFDYFIKNINFYQ
jgi:hypothetical protein